MSQPVSEERELKLERLRQEIQIGLDDLEAGRVVEVDDLGEFLQERVRASRARAAR